MMNRKHKSQWISGLMTLLLLVSLLGVAPQPSRAQDNTWAAWAKLDIKALGDDKTGATFAMSADVQTPAGKPALQVTPGGKSEETKLAMAVSGADLQDWNVFTALALEVNLPETNAFNPNRFFLGMAEVTGDWTWVAGVFGNAETKPGWITVRYPFAEAMQKIKADGKYMLYFSFFNDKSGSKKPLTEAFYLGGATLSGPKAVGAGNRFQTEADNLLKLDDAGLVSAVARETFDYFWTQANPQNGLIRDRSTVDSPASIAAVGFGLTALPIGVERGWITKDQGYARALLTLKTFTNGGVQGKFGFFYHFIDMKTGERVWSSEVSSIDTALFIAGALTAGAYFKGTEVEQLANKLYEAIEWDAFSDKDGLVSMGWKPEDGFLRNTWDHFDESLLLYILAIGSPTHPLSAEAWQKIKRPVSTAGEFIYLVGEPLFVYQYPLAWLDLKDREDAFANYWNNTTRACQRNKKFSEEIADSVKTYRDGVWGLSAGDGPKGYRAYGAAMFYQDGTISPYASVACLPFTANASLASMRAMLKVYGAKVWGEYGFVSGINADVNWYSSDFIGIDQGDILLMIANAQDSFVWKLVSQNQSIQNALKKVGFIDKKSDYAVTPAFLAKYK